jgi:glycosyltransferase involved in cell wall biosynthesis
MNAPAQKSNLSIPDSRPAVAIVSNSQTPYRLNLHCRIAREIPQIRLFSVYTHEISNAPWAFAAPQEIGAVLFGKGETCNAPPTPGNLLKEWKRGGQIIEWMKKNDIRFVVMMGYNDAGRMRMMRHCRRAGIPCFLFGDSNILGDRATGLKKWLKRRAVNKFVRWCDGILCCGRLGREFFQKYGAKDERIFHFPYEPDYSLTQNVSDELLAQIRRKFNLKPSARRIVFSGRLIDVKRPDLLIDAFVGIANRRPNCELLVIGDGPLRQSLQDRLPPELRGRVTWTGFIDDQATVAALYRLSDVLVLPSDFEPWAVVINEAASAGLAIISTNVVGAAAELVREGVNGHLFPAGDLRALIDCLLDVTDPIKLERMKAASADVLADWRRRGDPIDGLRKAMASVGLALASQEVDVRA